MRHSYNDFLTKVAQASTGQGLDRIAVGEFNQALPYSQRALEVLQGQRELSRDPKYRRQQAKDGALTGAGLGFAAWQLPGAIGYAGQNQVNRNRAMNQSFTAHHMADIWQDLPAAQRRALWADLGAEIPFLDETATQFRPGSKEQFGLLLSNMRSRTHPDGAVANELLAGKMQQRVEDLGQADPEFLQRAGPKVEKLRWAAKEGRLPAAGEAVSQKLMQFTTALNKPMGGKVPGLRALPRPVALLGGLAAANAARRYVGAGKDQEDLDAASRRPIGEVEQYLRKRDTANALQRKGELSQNELEGKARTGMDYVARNGPEFINNLILYSNLTGMMADPGLG